MKTKTPSVPSLLPKLLIDARGITNEMDGLGYYSLYFVRRLVREFKGCFNFIVVVPASLRNTGILEQTLPQYVKLVHTTYEKFTGSICSDDSEAWDHFIASIAPDLYISTAFFTTGYRCKRIVVIHDLIPILLPNLFAPEKVRFYAGAIAHTIHKSELLLAVSDYTRQDIIKHFGKETVEIKVLYPDIESIIAKVKVAYISSHINHGRYLVLGVKCPRKNAPLVVESLALTQRRGLSSIKVYFVGKMKPSDTSLIDSIARHSLKDTATVLGYVSDRRLLNLIAGSKGLLFPSDYEGFGIPVLEFLCAHKLIVCKRNSSLPEISGNLVHYCGDDPSEWAELLLAIERGEKHCADVLSINKHLRSLQAINAQQWQGLFEWIRKAV